MFIFSFLILEISVLSLGQFGQKFNFTDPLETVFGLINPIILNLLFQ